MNFPISHVSPLHRFEQRSNITHLFPPIDWNNLNISSSEKLVFEIGGISNRNVGAAASWRSRQLLEKCVDTSEEIGNISVSEAVS
jgi:hypothetical protein